MMVLGSCGSPNTPEAAVHKFFDQLLVINEEFNAIWEKKSNKEEYDTTKMEKLSQDVEDEYENIFCYDGVPANKDNKKRVRRFVDKEYAFNIGKAEYCKIISTTMSEDQSLAVVEFEYKEGSVRAYLVRNVDGNWMIEVNSRAEIKKILDSSKKQTVQ